MAEVSSDPVGHLYVIEHQLGNERRLLEQQGHGLADPSTGSEYSYLCMALEEQNHLVVALPGGTAAMQSDMSYLSRGREAPDAGLRQWSNAQR